MPDENFGDDVDDEESKRWNTSGTFIEKTVDEERMMQFEQSEDNMHFGVEQSCDYEYQNSYNNKRNEQQ